MKYGWKTSEWQGVGGWGDWTGLNQPVARCCHRDFFLQQQTRHTSMKAAWLFILFDLSMWSDSIAVLLFVDIVVEFDSKIQITILILIWGALSTCDLTMAIEFAEWTHITTAGEFQPETAYDASTAGPIFIFTWSYKSSNWLAVRNTLSQTTGILLSYHRVGSTQSLHANTK